MRKLVALAALCLLLVPALIFGSGDQESTTEETTVSTEGMEFNEAPLLAEMVKRGEIPPLAERLPEEPLILEPVDEIGQYGGIWRRGFVGPGDV